MKNKCPRARVVDVLQLASGDNLTPPRGSREDNLMVLHLCGERSIRRRVMSCGLHLILHVHMCHATVCDYRIVQYLAPLQSIERPTDQPGQTRFGGPRFINSVLTLPRGFRNRPRRVLLSATLQSIGRPTWKVLRVSPTYLFSHQGTVRCFTGTDVIIRCEKNT